MMLILQSLRIKLYVQNGNYDYSIFFLGFH